MNDHSVLSASAQFEPQRTLPRSEQTLGNAAMRRKVLFVESGSGYGGSAFSLFRLVKNLDRSRYEAHVVVFHSAEAFEQIRSLGTTLRTIRFFRPFWGRTPEDRGFWTKTMNYCSFYGNFAADTFCNGIRLARYIRREQIELVHLNNCLLDNFSAAFAARLVRIPCVSHVRGTEPIARIEKYFAHWLAAVITLNSAVFDDYALLLGEEKVHLICNGVDLDAFQEPNPQKIRQEFNLQPKTFAVGTFARLVDGKGIPEFIATAGRVIREHGNSRFFVVGHGTTKDRAFEVSMRKLAGEVGLGSQLVFTGWRNDRIDILAAMDLVVQISTTFPEGMSLAPLEAMALGKPVIVTTIPGYEFAVDDGTTGFTVAPGDIDALAEKVLLLARHRDLARRMGQEGYQRALHQFDVRLTARKVQTVYDQVLDHR